MEIPTCTTLCVTCIYEILVYSALKHCNTGGIGKFRCCFVMLMYCPRYTPSHRRRGATTGFDQNRHHRSFPLPVTHVFFFAVLLRKQGGNHDTNNPAPADDQSSHEGHDEGLLVQWDPHTRSDPVVASW